MANREDIVDLQKRIDEFTRTRSPITRPIPPVKSDSKESQPGYQERMENEIGREVLNAARRNALSWLLNDAILDNTEKENDKILNQLAINIDTGLYPETAKSLLRLGNRSGTIDRETLNKAVNILKNGAAVSVGVGPMTMLDSEQTARGLEVPMMKYLDDMLNKGLTDNPCDRLAAPDAQDPVIDDNGNMAMIPLDALQEKISAETNIKLIPIAFKALITPLVDFVADTILKPLRITPIKKPIDRILNNMKKKAENSLSQRNMLDAPPMTEIDKGVPMQVNGPWKDGQPSLTTKNYRDGVYEVVDGIIDIPENPLDGEEHSSFEKYEAIVDFLHQHERLPVASDGKWFMGSVTASVSVLPSAKNSYPYLRGTEEGLDPYAGNATPCLQAALSVVQAVDKWTAGRLRGDPIDPLACAVQRFTDLTSLKDMSAQHGFIVASALPEGDPLGDDIENRLNSKNSPWARNGVADISKSARKASAITFANVMGLDKISSADTKTRLACPTIENIGITKSG